MPRKKNTDKLFKTLTEHIEAESGLEWNGTLKDYIELVVANKNLNISAHKRMLDMIESHGVDRDEDGNITKYNFFSDDLFGIGDSLEHIMSYLRAAAAGSEVSKRILLMYGPTSSGKSQLAILLKRGLEEYTKTDAGAVYALADSPMFEDPLCAIPHELRESLKKDYGLRIDGQLSPYMDFILREKYGSNFLELPNSSIPFEIALNCKLEISN